VRARGEKDSWRGGRQSFTEAQKSVGSFEKVIDRKRLQEFIKTLNRVNRSDKEGCKGCKRSAMWARKYQKRNPVGEEARLEEKKFLNVKHLMPRYKSDKKHNERSYDWEGSRRTKETLRRIGCLSGGDCSTKSEK